VRNAAPTAIGQRLSRHDIAELPGGTLLAAGRATRPDDRDACAYSPWAVLFASASASILARRV
jgi:hypothetical protein